MSVSPAKVQKVTQKPQPMPHVNIPEHPMSSPRFVDGTPDWVQPIIDKAAKAHNIPTMLLSALIKQESNFNPNARSKVGALGISQFMPTTAKGMGVDPMNPDSAIMGTAQYLRRAWDKYGDPKLAVGSYNAGGGAIDKYHGLPPYPETQNYVKNIFSMASAPHASANQPYLDTMNQLKKNQPQVLGTETQRILNQPSTPYNFRIDQSGTTNSNVQKYPGLTSPIPQSDVVGPFTAPIPDSDVLSYQKPVDIAPPPRGQNRFK